MRGALTSGLRMLAPVVLTYGVIAVLALVALYGVMRVIGVDAVTEADLDRARAVARATAIGIPPQAFHPEAETHVVESVRASIVEMFADEPEFSAIYALRPSSNDKAFQVVAEYRADGKGRSFGTHVDASAFHAILEARYGGAATEIRPDLLFGVAAVTDAEEQLLGMVVVEVRPRASEVARGQLTTSFLVLLALTVAAFGAASGVLGQWFSGFWRRVLIVPVAADDELASLRPRFERLAQRVEDRRIISDIRLVKPEDVDAVLGIKPRAGAAAEVRIATVLVARLHGVAALSEVVGAAESIAMLNAYLAMVCEAVETHDGTLLQVYPTSVLATFGAPVPVQGHASRAVMCAREIRRRLQRLVREWEKVEALRRFSETSRVHVRVGVHCGDVVTGRIGTKSRRQYALVGEVVEVAQGLDVLGSERHSVLITETAVEQATDAAQYFDVGRQVTLLDGSELRVFTI